MIKIIGAALVLSAAAYMGLSGVLRLRNHARTLETFITSLDILDAELCSRLSPMRDVLEKLSSDAPVPARVFFRSVYDRMDELSAHSFYSIWSGALRCSEALTLSAEEERTIGELGLYLGRYDAREQSENIRRTRLRLERCLASARETRDRDTKLHAALGLSAGALAVIMLL